MGRPHRPGTAPPYPRLWAHIILELSGGILDSHNLPPFHRRIKAGPPGVGPVQKGAARTRPPLVSAPMRVWNTEGPVRLLAQLPTGLRPGLQRPSVAAARNEPMASGPGWDYNQVSGLPESGAPLREASSIRNFVATPFTLDAYCPGRKRVALGGLAGAGVDE
jgi:hypothetical protein